MSIRVAFVLSALRAGGAERVIDLISSAAVARGWTVTIVSFDGPDDPVFHDYDRRVTLLRLNLPAGARAVPRRVRALRGVLRAGGFDAVVSFLGKINVLTLAATRGSGLPVIVSERNNPRAQPMSPLWRLAQRGLYPFAARIVMQTARSVGCLPPRLRARAIVIPNPVRLDPSPPRSCRPGHIAAVGRLTHQKGFDLLVAAFAGVAGTHPDWRLLIWGEGPDRAALADAIARAGMDGRIVLAGLSDAPVGWTGDAAIYVLSSRYEGFPNALLEAMAAGLAVAAFDCDYGAAELVNDGANGLLVPDGDVPALAHAMARLMGDAMLRTRLGACARTSAAALSEERLIPAWLDCISGIVPGAVDNPK